MDICSAILAINPEARVSCIEEDYDRITWLDGTTPINKSDIQAKQAELQAEYDSKQYQRDRKEEYASIPDQLDYIYHNGVEKWKTDMILPVKEKYPKGDS